MKPLTMMYWTRVLFGVVAALICTFLMLTVVDSLGLLNGLTIALILYLITYYFYKSHFISKVDKSSKLFTTGAFAYFLTWIVIWVLLSTIFIYNV